LAHQVEYLASPLTEELQCLSNLLKREDAVLESTESRIERVADYILQHPEDDLSLETLSRLANFSKFHFLRVFQAQKGISAGKMV
jgi:AraC-like DNA-binding protein